MGGCSVRGCSNSLKKGFTMKLVPRDKERREIWLKAINRPTLTSSVGAVVCEIHFDENSWEKVRVDGSRKLKLSAVPTLFLNNSGKKQRDPSTNPVQSCPIEVTEAPTVEQHAYEVLIDIDTPVIIESDLHNFGTELHNSEIELHNSETETHNSETEQNNPETESHNFEREAHDSETEAYDYVTEYISNNSDDEHPQEEQMFQRNTSENSNHDQKSCNDIIQRYEMRLRKLEKKLRVCVAENKRLKSTASDGSALKGIFNDDQIEIMKNKHKKCKKWSNETLKQALKLRFACGNTGYNELRRQKFPLPSTRTLSNSI